MLANTTWQNPPSQPCPKPQAPLQCNPTSAPNSAVRLPSLSPLLILLGMLPPQVTRHPMSMYILTHTF